MGRGSNDVVAGRPPADRRRRLTITFRGYLAVGLSLIVAAGLWAQLVEADSLFGIEGPTVPFPSFISPLALLFVVSPIAILVTIVVDILAGVHGGQNRLAGGVGGMLLLSPILWLVIANVV
jgi:hypothetical protein